MAVLGEWPMGDICRLRAVRVWIQTKQEEKGSAAQRINYKMEKLAALGLSLLPMCRKLHITWNNPSLGKMLIGSTEAHAVQSHCRPKYLCTKSSNGSHT